MLLDHRCGHCQTTHDMRRYLGAANRVLAEYRIENALLGGGPRLRAYVAGTRAVCPSDSPLHA